VGKPLRVLIAADSEAEALQLICELKEGGYEPLHERVEGAEDLRAAIRERTWDILVYAYTRNGLSGPDLLDIMKESGTDIPCIIVSEEMDEETLIETMRSGANDVIRKDRHHRLICCIERELREAAVRRRAHAEEADRQNEGNFRLLVESAPDAIFVQTGGSFAYVNPATVLLFGADSAEQLLGRPLLERIAPDFRDIRWEELRLLDEEKKASLTKVRKYVKLDGTLISALVSSVPVRYDNRQGSISYIRDITTRTQSEGRLNESREKLRKALGATIQAIALMVETRDPYTAGHQRRVSDLARSIARTMRVTSDQVDGIRMAGLIHDIGKISVPAEILSKPVRLTAIETGLISIHPQAGFEVLKDIDFPWPIAEIIHQHHERMDGSGYPRGLAGDGVCLEARVLAVADVVEAMASHRPYRPGLGLESAIEEITANRGRLYDERVVDACLNVFNAGYDFPAS
jgi:PAS domain S-box-containing protein/putative nucleotidyltransferase with HDIG domain